MDSEKTKQRAGWTPQNRHERLGGRDERQEHLCAVEHDAEERHEQNEADESRYTHRVAISNSRLIAADATGVTFRYKDYRIKGLGRYKTMTL
jgi:Putative transposase